jgi:Spy/CpxP family protein refolding chaperone
MKKTIATCILACAFGTPLLIAQGTRTPPDPASVAQRRVNRLTTLLALNAAQQQAALTIFTNAAVTDQSIRTSLKSARQSLSAAVKSNDTGSITSWSNTIGSLTVTSVSSDATAAAAFYQLLTPSQQATYNQGPGRGGFGGGLGGPGFGGRRF